MPKKRGSLSESERRASDQRLEGLRLAGLDVPPLPIRDEVPEWIWVECSRPESFVRSSMYCAVFAVYVHIVGAASGVTIDRYELTSPDWEVNGALVEDPNCGRFSAELYKLFDGSTFHHSEVVNHRVNNEGKLKCGEFIEGLVLMQGYKPLPDHYNVANPIPLTFSVVDKRGRSCDTRFALPVERFTMQMRARSGPGLFEQPSQDEAFPQSRDGTPPDSNAPRYEDTVRSVKPSSGRSVKGPLA